MLDIPSGVQYFGCMKLKLLDDTYRLLDESPLTIREIAAGAGVGFHWVGKFKQRTFPNPGVNAVEAVHTFLAAQQDA